MNELSVRSCGEAVARAWRSRAATKALLVAGIVAAGGYVVGDVISGLVYQANRPYSFKDQWIDRLRVRSDCNQSRPFVASDQSSTGQDPSRRVERSLSRRKDMKTDPFGDTYWDNDTICINLSTADMTQPTTPPPTLAIS
jgi:hypothetical protein